MADTVDRLITKVEIQGEQNVVQGLGRLGGVMKGIAGISALMAAARAYKPFVDAAMESQRVAAQFEATQKAVGAAFPVEEAAAYATALERVSVFSDEDILSGERRLLELQLTRKQTEAILPQILDLASAFQAEGMSVEDAAEKIGRAFSSGNIAQLRRFGLVIDEVTFKRDRLKALSDALDRFRGQTEALRGTATGAVLAFNQAWDDLKETLGVSGTSFLERVLPGVTELIQGVNTVIQKIQDAVGWVTRLFDIWGQLEDVFGPDSKKAPGATGNPPGTAPGGAAAAATRAFLGGGNIGRIGIAPSELPDLKQRANNAPVTVRIEGDDTFETAINKVLAKLTRHGIIRPAGSG